MIRPATPYDDPALAQLIILAMGNSLAGKFANSGDMTVITALFEKFTALPGNLYSYRNILVWQEDEQICGMILGYDGAKLYDLREPFLEYTRAELGFRGTPEDETQADEFYIDCLAVFPQHQGKGIAKDLIKALTAKATSLGHHKMGLLVSKGNDKARKLYEQLGFKMVGEKSLLGGSHYHLQYAI
ncbi:hypothetical protein A0256_07610 [Mucilaginibacter sp. PAMC 26640]|nr:hypothetical protein A0256_07610 [Mucilaginibacter sp. PAMC 26640]